VIWNRILDQISDYLVRGVPVCLSGICTLEPFTKRATHTFHPALRKVRAIPARRHLRMILSPVIVQRLRRQG
jgi:hypothetical protein